MTLTQSKKLEFLLSAHIQPARIEFITEWEGEEYSNSSRNPLRHFRVALNLNNDKFMFDWNIEWGIHQWLEEYLSDTNHDLYSNYDSWEQAEAGMLAFYQELVLKVKMGLV